MNHKMETNNVPQVLPSSPIAKPKRMELKKWTIIFVASFHLILCGFMFLLVVGSISGYESTDTKIRHYSSLFGVLVWAVPQVVGLTGAVRTNVCSIGFYFGWNVFTFGFYLLALCFVGFQNGYLNFETVLTGLYTLVVYYFLQDCRTVQKSAKQQQQQQYVVYRT